MSELPTPIGAAERPFQAHAGGGNLGGGERLGGPGETRARILQPDEEILVLAAGEREGRIEPGPGDGFQCFRG